MLDVSVMTLAFGFLLLVIAVMQPVALRLRVSPTVLLAAVGVALGAAAAWLYASRIEGISEIVTPIAGLPVKSSVILYVFLPLLLMQASLMIEVRRIMEDAVPILVLAVVAVVLAAATIGFSLEWLFGVPLLAALLLGAIVATTDPAAVVAIFRDIGAPARLTRLVEGESLLNDAAAIALFSLLLAALVSGRPLDPTAAAIGFLFAFTGGIAAGAAAGWMVARAMRHMAGIKAAEVTLTIAAAYIIYITSEKLLGVSGVVAVVVSGLTIRAYLPARIMPDNWRHLANVWEQVAFWAGSLVFILAAVLVPRILTNVGWIDVLMVLAVVVASLVARAAVLFGILPILGMMRLATKVSVPYSTTILWGGLRGAVTLALALAITENRNIDPDIKRFVAVTATGFVLFTLFVNGLTLRRVIHWLRLDQLSPVDQGIRDQVLTLALADVTDAVRVSATRYGLHDQVRDAVVQAYEARMPGVRAIDDLDPEAEALSDRERLGLGIVALAARERELVLHYHARQTIAVDIVEDMLRHAERLLEGARSDGRIGYNRAARRTMDFGPTFRLAYWLHRSWSIDVFLRRRLARRFEKMLVLSLILTELAAYVDRRILPILGSRIASLLADVIASRRDAVHTALEALRLQYPAYAEAVEKEFLVQIAEQQELRHYDELYEEGMVGAELHENLRRAVLCRGSSEMRATKLDLTLNTSDMVRSLPIFEGLAASQMARLTAYLKPLFVIPGQSIVRRGDNRLGLFFIVSGAVEVRRNEQRIHLGCGDFFGEISLLTGQPRTADVSALTFSHLLTLSAEDFTKFLNEYPEIREKIERVAAQRVHDNMHAAA